MAKHYMEEMREAAIGYYNNLKPELQRQAHRFFRSMDRNGDGRVNYNEFIYFLNQRGYHWVHPNMFLELDKNRDGALDFYEVLTFYYIVKTRNVWCQNCRLWLKGLYFTCVTCFDDSARGGAGGTCDLCVRCYQQRAVHRYHSHHDIFVDNYTLLHCKRSSSHHAPAANVNLQVINAQPEQEEASSRR
ncbi:uncharacterized protein LOC110816162, partial [Carica papaya]